MGDGRRDLPRRRVFAVNSSTAVLAALRELLVDEGYAVVTATYATDPFPEIAALRPDALVVDLAPEEDAGWDLLDRLRADPATGAIPVLVVSTDPGMLERAREQSPRIAACRYLAKPFAIDDVVAAVDELLRKR
jgi:DNA-binding response OmpR family regulator